MDTAETPATPAPPVTPAERLREGIVGTAVTTKAGTPLIIIPARVTAAELLNGCHGSQLRYAELAQITRDQWLQSRRGVKTAIDDDAWYELVTLAIIGSYEVTEDEISELKWFDPIADIMAIAAATWGHGSVDKIRKRALALACAGLADLPLSAMENANLADWTWNAKLAPPLKET